MRLRLTVALLAVIALVGVTIYVLNNDDAPPPVATIFPRVEFRPLLGQPVPIGQQGCSARYVSPEAEAVLPVTHDDTTICYRLGTSELVPRAAKAEPTDQSTGGSSPTEWGINVQLSSNDSRLFAALTERTRGQMLAIVIVEGSVESPQARVASTPVVNEPITSGELVISGNFTQQEARRLAAALTR